MRPKDRQGRSESDGGQLPSQLRRLTVPCLLPQNVKLAEASVGLTPSLGVQLYKRVYTFRWMPLGAMARLIVRFQAYRDYKLERVWRQGLVLRSKSGRRGLVNCTVDYNQDLFQLTLVASEGGLAAALRSTEQSSESVPPMQRLRRSMIHEMVLVVDGWIQDSFAQADTKREIVCSRCLATAPDSAPGLFPFEALTLMLVNGEESVACSVCRAAVKVAELAPDLTFSALPILTDVTVGEFLGRGGFANVYRGTLADGTEVAVKEVNHLCAQRKQRKRNNSCRRFSVSSKTKENTKSTQPPERERERERERD